MAKNSVIYELEKEEADLLLDHTLPTYGISALNDDELQLINKVYPDLMILDDAYNPDDDEGDVYKQ